MNCIKCKSPQTKRYGFYRDYQRYKCNSCGRQFSERSFSFFSRHRFPKGVISNAILLNHQISTRMVKHFFRQNNCFFHMFLFTIGARNLIGNYQI